MILERYSTFDFINELSFDDGFKLIEKAREEKNKNLAWEIWLTKLPYMTKDNYISFNDYYKKITVKPSNRSTEDILSMVQEIRKKAKKNGNI